MTISIEKLVMEGRYKEAYLRLSMGEHCDPTAAEECRIRIEGTSITRDNIFRNMLIHTEHF